MAFKFTGFADEASADPAEQCDITLEAGWSSIELRKIHTKNVCDLEPDEWQALWQLLQEKGITVAGFGSQLCNWARPIDTGNSIVFPGTTRPLDAIAFNTVDSDWPEDARRVNIAYRLDVNVYRGIERPQLVVEHLECC